MTVTDKVAWATFCASAEALLRASKKKKGLTGQWKINQGTHARIQIVQADITSMVTHYGLGDGQAQANTSRIATAGILQPEERGEHLFPGMVWDTGPVILDDDVDTFHGLEDTDPSLFAIPDGINNDVGGRLHRKLHVP